jgi:tetratricopeptide (TPR) repeat protein
MSEVEQSPPAPAAATGTGSSGDFLQHLNLGGELLMAGNNREALAELELAFHLEPKNAKAQNLLGLAHFKLGQLDRAAEIYELLVHDNPADATLRINLGLVHLKAEANDRAIRQLQTAVDLSADRQKPLNYLGLAYAQAGRHAQALDAFRKAGNQAMVEKMERAMAAAAAAGGAAKPVAAEPVAAEPVAAEPVAAELSVDVEVAEPPTPRPASIPSPQGPSKVEGPPSSLDRSSGPTASSTQPTVGLSGLLQKLADTGGAEPFQVTPEGARLRVRGELHSRLAGLCWLRGTVQRTPAQRRFRGLATDKPFGEGPDRLQALAGQGELFVAAAGLFALGVDEPLYLREDALFAFEGSLTYENGRISSPAPPDLLLVHLAGKGQALLRLNGALRSLQIGAAEPLELPMDRLVGWTGALMPSVIQESGTDARARWLRLEGEGWVLWTVPPK